MAYTFLRAVEMVLQRVHEISGDVGQLSGFDDSGRQTKINAVRQLWNDVVADLYATSRIPLPRRIGEAAIVLRSDQRQYPLPRDFSQMRWPLIREDDGYLVYEYPGGYEQMRVDRSDIRQWKGEPCYAVIEPVRRELLFDRIPTSEQAGSKYNLIYDRVDAMMNEDDIFPFSDNVVESLVRSVAELYNREHRSSFDAGIYARGVASAARLLNPNVAGRTW